MTSFLLANWLLLIRLEDFETFLLQLNSQWTWNTSEGSDVLFYLINVAHLALVQIYIKLNLYKLNSLLWYLKSFFKSCDVPGLPHQHHSRLNFGQYIWRKKKDHRQRWISMEIDQIEREKITSFVMFVLSKTVHPMEMSVDTRLIEMESGSLTLWLVCVQTHEKLLLWGLSHPGVVYGGVHQQAAAQP